MSIISVTGILPACLSASSRPSAREYAPLARKTMFDLTYSAGVQHTLSQHFKIPAAIHLAFEQLQPVDLAFHLSLAP